LGHFGRKWQSPHKKPPNGDFFKNVFAVANRRHLVQQVVGYHVQTKTSPMTGIKISVFRGAFYPPMQIFSKCSKNRHKLGFRDIDKIPTDLALDNSGLLNLGGGLAPRPQKFLPPPQKKIFFFSKFYFFEIRGET
jgi:hypothetical protein